MTEEMKTTETSNGASPTGGAAPEGGAAPAGGATQDPLAALQAELEGERARANDAVKMATGPLTARISSLESSLGERETQVTQLTGDLGKAVEEYRALIVAANPLIPADMLAGKSIEELKTSAQKAQAFIASITTAVKTQLEAAAQAAAIPAGAPERTENTDNLSPREKITLGLRKAQK